MRENRDFVVPVNILTPLRAPRFLGPHDTTVCLDVTYHNYSVKSHTSSCSLFSTAHQCSGYLGWCLPRYSYVRILFRLCSATCPGF